MDMYTNSDFTTTVDMKKEVRVAKGEWLNLQMQLMNKIDDSKFKLIKTSKTKPRMSR